MFRVGRLCKRNPATVLGRISCGKTTGCRGKSRRDSGPPKTGLLELRRDGEIDQGHEIVDAELSHEANSARLDRRPADPIVVGDFAIVLALQQAT